MTREHTRRSVLTRATSALRICAVVALAVTAALEFAHLLELPQKMAYDPELYVRVSHSLYLWFAYVGAPVEILGVLLPAALAVVLRRTPGFTPAVVAAGCAALAFALWIVLVSPANAEFAGWTPHSVPGDWTYWRARWEVGHAVALPPLLAGIAALVRIR